MTVRAARRWESATCARDGPAGRAGGGKPGQGEAVRVLNPILYYIIY